MTEERVNDAAFKEYEYDESNRLAKTTFHVGGEAQEYIPIYDKNENDKIYADNAVVGVTLDGVFTAKAEHDSFGRVTQKNFTLDGSETALLKDEFTYIGTSSRLTKLVHNFKQFVNGIIQGIYTYDYDNNGNITEIQKNSATVAKYTYDGMNQLIREDNALTNKSYTFAYDTAGNILHKKEYDYTTGALGTEIHTDTYTYATTGWKDQLISFNGENIAYDSLGNPTTYRNHTLTWGKIRQLESYDNHTFAYDASGIRTRKDNITHTLDGTTILAETRPTGTIKYLYGTSGVCGFTYNGNTYYYEKNLQGDVTAIYDVNGNKKAAYIYDAWGNHTVTTDIDGIGSLNPFRYRSYYFDSETGLYYLRSRYYDPQVGRFLNSDNYISVGAEMTGCNSFTYCGNNSIAYYDPKGHSRFAARYLMTDSGGGGNSPIRSYKIGVDYSNPNANKISGDFDNGIIKGSGSLTFMYDETSNRIQASSSKNSNSAMIGGYGKTSAGNVSGKIGVGSDELSLSLKEVADIATVSTQVGIQKKDGYGVAIKGKAAVLSGRSTLEFSIFGWQLEIGVSGDILSLGAEAMIGYFPDEGFVIKKSVGVGLFGWGFLIRINPNT